MAVMLTTKSWREADAGRFTTDDRAAGHFAIPASAARFMFVGPLFLSGRCKTEWLMPLRTSPSLRTLEYGVRLMGSFADGFARMG